MAITVTGSAVTNPGIGVGLQVVVLTGQAGNFPGNVASAAIAAGAVQNISVTTTTTGSYVLVAGGCNSAAANPTAAASNTLIGNFSDSGNNANYWAVRSTAVTGTPGAFTAGCSTLGRGAVAALEVKPGGPGLAIDGSTPAFASSAGTATAVSASFTPPAGALLVALFYAEGQGTSSTQTTQVSDSSGLVWTKQAEVSTTAISGVAAIWTARVPGVTYDAAGPSSAGTAFTATTGTWTQVNNGNGILVGATVFTGSADTITGVTYGGVALSKIGFQSDGAAGGGISFWRLVGPACPTGSNTVQVTKTGTDNCNAGSVSVNGAGSLGTPAFASDAVGSTSRAVTVNGTTAGGLLVTVAAHGATGATWGLTGGTIRWNKDSTSNSGSDNGACGTAPSTGGGANQTLTWTNTTSDDWAVIAVEVLPAAALLPEPPRRVLIPPGRMSPMAFQRMRQAQPEPPPPPAGPVPVSDSEQVRAADAGERITASLSDSEAARAADAGEFIPGALAPYLAATPISAATGTTSASTLTHAVAAGDAVIVATTATQATGAVTSVTDTKGNAYALARLHNTGTYDAEVWVSDGSAAMTTSDVVTVNWAATPTAPRVAVLGCPGLAASSVTDVAASANGTSAAPSSGATATLAMADELAIGVISDANAGGAVAWTAPWHSIASVQTGATEYMGVAWQETSATTGVTASGTITSAAWTAIAVTLKTPAAGPGADTEQVRAAEAASVQAFVFDPAESPDVIEGGERVTASLTGTEAVLAADAGERITASLKDADAVRAADGTEGKVFPDSDKAQASEAASLTASLADAEAVRVTDAGERAQVTISDSDAARVTEAASLTASLTSPETAAATETGSIRASLADADAARVTDAGEAVRAALTDAEAARVTDAGERTSVSVTSAESVTAAESASLAASLAAGDTAQVTDSQSLRAFVPDSEAAAASEASETVRFGTTETARAADGTENVTSLHFDTDVTAAAESGSVRAGLPDSEAARAAEASETVRFTGPDTARAADAGEVIASTQPVSDSETARVSEAQSLSASLATTETAIVTETGVVSGATQPVADTEAARATEAQAVRASLASAEGIRVVDAGEGGAGSQFKYDTETWYVIESGFSYLVDSDAAQAAEAGETVSQADAETARAAERELSSWPSDTDKARAAESASVYWSGPLSDSDKAQASEGNEAIAPWHLSDADAVRATEHPVTFDAAPYIDLITWAPTIVTSGGMLFIVAPSGRTVLAAEQPTHQFLNLAWEIARSAEVAFVHDAESVTTAHDGSVEERFEVSLLVRPALNVTLSLTPKPITASPSLAGRVKFQ